MYSGAIHKWRHAVIGGVGVSQKVIYDDKGEGGGQSQNDLSDLGRGGGMWDKKTKL